MSRRIETELRERLEEAIDAACLDTLVRVRRARGLPPPVADSERDRAAYQAEVHLLLDRLDAHFAPLADEGPRRHDTHHAGVNRLAQLMARQVMMARALPDYWQRFEAVRIDYTEARTTSGGEGRGLLRRLFGLS